MRTLLAASLLALSTFVVGCAGEPDDGTSASDEEVATSSSELRFGSSLADLLAKTKRDTAQRSFDVALASLRAPNAAGVEGLRQIDGALATIEASVAKGALPDGGTSMKDSMKEKDLAPTKKEAKGSVKAAHEDAEEDPKDLAAAEKRSKLDEAELKVAEAREKAGKTKTKDPKVFVQLLRSALVVSHASACASASIPKLEASQARINQALAETIADAIEGTKDREALTSLLAGVRGALELGLAEGCSDERGVAAIPRGVTKP